MPRARQPVDIWPRWLHVGCLSCSTLLAVLLVAGAGGFAFYAWNSVGLGEVEDLPGRAVPVVRWGDASVMVVRAANYRISKACYVGDRGALAMGGPSLTLGGIFTTVLRNPSQSADLLADLMATTRPLLIPQGKRPRELAPPVRPQNRLDVEDVQVGSSGQHAVVLLGYYPKDAVSENLWDKEASELWLLDLSTQVWRNVAYCGRRDVQTLALLDQSPRVLYLSKDDEGDHSLLYMAMPGKEPQALCEVPGLPRRLRIEAEGRKVALAYYQMDDINYQSRIVRVDLETGAKNEGQITMLAGTHPGPLAPSETLVDGHRIGALDWQAARIRWITTKSPAMLKAHACRNGRWALASLTVNREGFSESSKALAAVNLAEGKFHLVSKEPPILEDVTSDGLRALVSVYQTSEAFPDPSKNYLGEVYVDWPAVEASRGIPKAENLLDTANKGRGRHRTGRLAIAWHLGEVNASSLFAGKDYR